MNFNAAIEGKVELVVDQHVENAKEKALQD
jgi:hypothetical protein